MIHFIFPSPDEFGQVDYFSGKMIAYVSCAGWSTTRECALSEIEPEYLSALRAAVMSIISLGENWQAVQVWAYKDTDPRELDDGQIEITDVINLRVEARHVSSHAVRVFTPADYPILSLSDPEMVAFYRHFTTSK